jgi:tetratricopeptide (TPR) repeat protein
MVADSLDAAREASLPPMPDALLGQGMVALFRGSVAEGTQALLRAQVVAAEESDHWRHAEALFALCRSALEAHDACAAVEWAQRALAVADKLAGGDEPMLARALLGLARLMRAAESGKTDEEALELLLSSSEELRRLEARWRLMVVTRFHADLELRAGRLSAAEDLACEASALEKRTQLGCRGMPDVILAEIALARGQPQRARDHLQGALKNAASAGELSAYFRSRVQSVASAIDPESKEAPSPGR